MDYAFQPHFPFTPYKVYSRFSDEDRCPCEHVNINLTFGDFALRENTRRVVIRRYASLDYLHRCPQGMDQDQNLTSQWLVNSDADLSSAITTATAFSDDPPPSNLLYGYQMPIMGTVKDDLQSNKTTDQLMTDTTWGSYDVSTSDSAPAAGAPFFLYSSANPTGVVWPKQENDSVDNHAPQFTNYDYPVWNENYVLEASQETMTHPIGATTRSSEVTDHMMAERKRREKLKQGFIALSAIIPGLKKTDKATVLEDATKYVKQLKERIEMLEKQTQSPTMMESVVLVKKTLLAFNDTNNPTFSIETSFTERTMPHEPLPVIEAKFNNKKVLIRVHCDNKTGVTEKILNEIVKLHLTVINSSVLSFGSSALDVTVIAQMNAECCMEEKELVKTLCLALKSFK